MNMMRLYLERALLQMLQIGGAGPGASDTGPAN